jgi:hypothetical protein
MGLEEDVGWVGCEDGGEGVEGKESETRGEETECLDSSGGEGEERGGLGKRDVSEVTETKRITCLRWSGTM